MLCLINNPIVTWQTLLNKIQFYYNTEGHHVNEQWEYMTTGSEIPPESSKCLYINLSVQCDILECLEWSTRKQSECWTVHTPFRLHGIWGSHRSIVEDSCFLGILCCVTGQEVPRILKDHSTFIFKIILLRLLDREHEWHSVISQKTGIPFAIIFPQNLN